MTIEVITPAPLLDTLLLLFERDHAPSRYLKAGILQCCQHDSAGLVADGTLISAFGFWPMGEKNGKALFDMWVVVRDSTLPHLVALAKFTRLALQRLTHDQPVIVRAHVKAGHRPGQRMARLAGLVHQETVDGVEFWETAP